MEDHKLLELIDEYLLGTISPGDQAALEKKMAEDPETKRVVQESLDAFRVIQAARNQQLREQMKQWDKASGTGNRRKDSRVKTGLAVFAFLLLLVMGSGYYYSPRVMADRYAGKAPFAAQALLSGEPLALWTKARFEFEHGHYAPAAQLFQTLSQFQDRRIAEEAKWQHLLCLLALGRSDGTWKSEMQALSGQTSHPHADEAREILSILDSWIYRTLYQAIYRLVSTQLKSSII